MPHIPRSRPQHRGRRSLAILMTAILVAALTALPAPAAEAASSVATTAHRAPLPSQDGVTLPCANTDLSCLTLRFAGGSPGYVAMKSLWPDRGASDRRPDYMNDPAVAKQFAWSLQTSATSDYFLIREASGDGRCLRWLNDSLIPYLSPGPACSLTDSAYQFTVRPFDDSGFQILTADGLCVSSPSRDSVIGLKYWVRPTPCAARDSAVQRGQVFTYLGNQKRLLQPLALKSAFASCFDAKQADTGRCEFAPGPDAATATPIVREQCARVVGGTFPFTNNSDSPQELTLSTERSGASSSTWKDAFKSSASLDGLVGKVLKVSAEYTREWGGSVSDSTKDTESRKLVVGPHRKAWVFYRDVYLPVPGTWTFDKGTDYQWTYDQIANIDVVGAGNITRERVDNFVPTSEITPDWTCTLRGAPEITGGQVPIVDTGVRSTSPTVGQRITVSTGTWNVTGDGWSYGYQWQLNGQPIAGATSADYQVRPADIGGVLSARVSASHQGYLKGYADSTRTAAVTAATPDGPGTPSTTPSTTVAGPTSPTQNPSTTAAAGPASSTPASPPPAPPISTPSSSSPNPSASPAPTTTAAPSLGLPPRETSAVAPSFVAPSFAAPSFAVPSFAAPSFAAPSFAAPSPEAPSAVAPPSSPTVPTATTPTATTPTATTPTVTTATIKPDSTDPSTAKDPLSLVVRLVTRPVPQFRGQAVLLDGDVEIDRHTVFGTSTIATDTFVLPADLAPGAHRLTVRFVPDDPAVFAPAEASVTIQAA